jgi:hypothetical protein
MTGNLAKYPGRARLLALAAAGGPDNGPAANLVVVLGAGLMVWAAVIHLHLWSTGYRHIPTIGPLFLLQGITAIVLAAVLVAFRRVWAALCSFGFVASTIGGFLLSVNVGLFGFQDSWSAPYATMAFGVEVAALAVLALGGALCLVRSRPAPLGSAPLGPARAA